MQIGDEIKVKLKDWQTCPFCGKSSSDTKSPRECNGDYEIITNLSPTFQIDPNKEYTIRIHNICSNGGIKKTPAGTELVDNIDAPPSADSEGKSWRDREPLF